MQLFARIISFLWFVFISHNFVAAQTPSRPNILLILVDDLRRDALGVTGHPFFKSPNVDRIANEGVLFQNAFVTHSLCSPSRATILTGLYSHQHGVVNNATRLKPGIQTVPQILRAAGYQTALIGKWHMGYPTAQPQPGFDRWVSFVGQGVYVDPLLNVDGQDVQTTGHMTDILTNYALEFLEEERSAPFFLMLSHKAVHGPITLQQKFAGLYSNANVTFPPTWKEDLSNKPSFLQHHLFNGNLKAFIQRYYECLAGVDESVGKILAKLEQKNLLENTLIIFTSDNGYFLGEHNLRDKELAYEESIRIPLLVRYPKWFAASSKTNAMALNLDIAPTLLEAAGIDDSFNLPGLSLRKLAKREAGRESFLYEYFVLANYPTTPAMRAIRTQEYKFITCLNSQETEELYHLRNDSLETKNLIDEPAFFMIVQRLRSQLDSLRKTTGDTFSNTVTNDQSDEPPEQFMLYQNYPNPFNPVTTIKYSLQTAGHVNLTILDVNGRKVTTLVDELQTPGVKFAQWDASGYASGLYFCQLATGARIQMRKIMVTK